MSYKTSSTSDFIERDKLNIIYKYLLNLKYNYQSIGVTEQDLTKIIDLVMDIADHFNERWSISQFHPGKRFLRQTVEVMEDYKTRVPLTKDEDNIYVYLLMQIHNLSEKSREEMGHEKRMVFGS